MVIVYFEADSTPVESINKAKTSRRKWYPDKPLFMGV